ncbi:hypothetical protein FOCC_FOCC001438 [Frankliniella occidentalis]|nr:hypothetical protein FOCC_FOCC001438 [Frankliniella occidentalis]
MTATRSRQRVAAAPAVASLPPSRGRPRQTSSTTTHGRAATRPPRPPWRACRTPGGRSGCRSGGRPLEAGPRGRTGRRAPGRATAAPPTSCGGASHRRAAGARRCATRSATCSPAWTRWTSARSSVRRGTASRATAASTAGRRTTTRTGRARSCAGASPCRRAAATACRWRRPGGGRAGGGADAGRAGGGVASTRATTTRVATTSRRTRTKTTPS